MVRSLGYLLVFGVVVACASASTSDAPAHLCTPGNYVFCRCKDRSEGTKLCNADGTSFAPCDGCLSGAAADQPGDKEPPPTDEPPPVEMDAAPPPDAAPPVDDAGVVLPRPKPGELFITEVMYDPSGPEPSEEWLEVVSVASKSVTLNGLSLRDAAGRTHGVPAAPAVVLAPGAYKLLVRNRPAAIATGLAAGDILVEYGTGDPDTGGVLLTNSASATIAILDGATEIVKVAFGAFGFNQSAPGGSSIQLKVQTASGAQTAAGWCLSTLIWPQQPITKNPQDKGSPGKPSNCP